MENRDFIVFGLQAWEIATISKDTAIEISRKNRVLFVNPPLTRSALLKNKNTPQVENRINILKGKEPGLIQFSPTLWILYPKTVIESINWIPFHSVFKMLNWLNENRFASKIKDAANSLNFKKFIILDDTSMNIGFYLKELLKPSLFIYLLRDRVTMVPYHAKHGAGLEPKIIEKSDLTITNSNYFSNYAEKYNKYSYFIGQGCDINKFNDKDGTLPIPEDIKKISRPIIGYVGALTAIRLDIEILIYTSKSMPGHSIVLVGPEDEKFQQSELHHLKNVFFLGMKNPKEVPAYIKGFDVAINPQIINPITDVNYPLKIDEYLAMGKPVVATKTTFMDYYFKDITYLALTKEEYPGCILRAIKEDSPQEKIRRIAIAQDHSWEIFVGKIYHYAKEAEERKRKKNSIHID